MLLNLISSKRALNHRGASSGNTFKHLPTWQSRELIDLIHDTHHLCTHFRTDGIKANIKWYFRGQTKDKICHCEKSRSTLFILSKKRFSHSKCTVRVSAKLTALLLATMASSFATPLKKVTITSTHNLTVNE